MRLKQQTTEQPRRFDATTTQQIIGMAARLKAERLEQLTQDQVEAIAAEVGIEPEYVRQSLTYMPVAQKTAAEKASPRKRGLTPLARWIAATGWMLPLFPWIEGNRNGAVAVNFIHGVHAVDMGSAHLVYSLVLLQGYLFWSVGLLRLARDQREGRKLGWLLALRSAWGASGWLSVLVALIVFSADGRYVIPGFLGTLVAYFGGLYWLKQLLPEEVRKPQKHNRDAAAATVSRDALLAQLFSLQQQLEGTRSSLSFLSLDVVGSSGIKKASSELSVEYTFSAYRRYILDIVQAEGGELQVAAGDGVMCVFRDEAAATRAAQRILAGLDRFNAAHNKVSEPLRVRAGINSGLVAWEPGTPIGFLQSVVIDEAARLQKEAEPNTLTLRDPQDPGQVITWKPT